jgi:hypothetical protein
MSLHNVTLRLGTTSQDAAIAIDGQDITRAVRAITLNARVGNLNIVTLEMFAMRMETIDLPADIVIQPVKVEALRPIDLSKAVALLVDQGYTLVRLHPSQRGGVFDAADDEDRASLIARLEELKRDKIVPDPGTGR